MNTNPMQFKCNANNQNSNCESIAPHIIVVGGTSGLGLALALHHQQLGWQVSVVGHSVSKISHINSQYPHIVTYTCDLTDTAQTQGLLDKLSDVHFQRLIYSAGSYLNERVHHLNQADSDKMLVINFQAFEQVFRWASACLKTQNQSLDFTKIDKPNLICIASIAGTMDYPYASLYAKSKRAMIVTASAYRAALAPYDIQVNCIAPGYIDTQALRDLNNGDASHKPFIMSTQTAVEHIMQAIDNDVELAIFPRSMRYITRALNYLPKPLLNWILRSKLDKKK
ncbi:SDR family NAD(P)-dependent oxidoreductase [Psychrobacter sp. DAB_AL62B]|uniref:SDR family NAD(P)-dependent oxidoreductase n=1 Tax=Psychrobacter sp. DAB_AL62B TaxID=1028420 RepID=UPI0023811715|nr:SDR family NAD(P)-dependent oxidoreductase [Psychrobacter sp. DAB_AL62B]MDE4455159.1 SDR family NAD(P)-dependent oxidoreductase [Psychrobacter sp. DAB_AL62B]